MQKLHYVSQEVTVLVKLTLFLFLFRQEAELRLVKHLPDILTLQKDLVKKFQNNTELTYDTIAEFLHIHKGGIKRTYTRRSSIHFNCMTHGFLFSEMAL